VAEGRTRLEGVPARAGNRDGFVIGVDGGLHDARPWLSEP
jgi:hypothetical protein